MSSPFFLFTYACTKFLISWHITIFAVHGFCGDLVVLCSYPTVGRANFLFFTFTQKVFVHVRIFFFFKARHLLKNIFHYASPCCVYSLTRHWLRRMFQHTLRWGVVKYIFYQVTCIKIKKGLNETERTNQQGAALENKDVKCDCQYIYRQ